MQSHQIAVKEGLVHQKYCNNSLVFNHNFTAFDFKGVNDNIYGIDEFPSNIHFIKTYEYCTIFTRIPKPKNPILRQQTFAGCAPPFSSHYELDEITKSKHWQINLHHRTANLYSAFCEHISLTIALTVTKTYIKHQIR